MKEVLVVHYSQTGQLSKILENIVAPLRKEETINLTFQNIIPVIPYSFPWKEITFLDTFPETFQQIPIKIEPLPSAIANKKYDLIIFGYQVWFLTPSRPANSFLKSEQAKQLFKDTPTITVIGCRNMWIMAQEKVKRLLQGLQANLVGNIALVDRHINHISVITITHWMFSGKKDAYLGIFPKPGVSDKDIAEANKFGQPIQTALLNNDYSTLQDKLLEKDAVKIKPFLITVDRRANFLFDKWAKLIRKKGNPGEPKRLKWVKLFKYYLLFAIWFIAPLVFVLFLLSLLPLHSQIRQDKAYFSSITLR